MPHADGGRGYAGTNWSTQPMTTIWQAMHNQQTEGHWTLLTGWRRSADLVLQHISAVQSYRDNLATAWPPDRSPAAAAYLTRLNTLIKTLHETYDAATANYDAFHAVTQALTAARRDLEPLVTEHEANTTKLAAYEEARSRGPIPIRGAQPPTSPVAEGRQAQLEARARAIMYGLSNELIEARSRLRTPPLYQDDRPVDDGESDLGMVSNPAQSRPTGSSSSPVGISSASEVSAASTPKAPESVSQRPPGLILGGVEAPSPTLPAPSIPSVGSPHPAPPSIGGAPPTPPLVGPGRMPAPPRSGSPFVQFPTAGGRALPPGAVIGAPGGTGLSQPAPVSRPPTNVNPIGGVIGPTQQPGARSGTAGTSGAYPPLMPGGGSQPANSRAETGKRWDPDNPWATATGVAPVIEPPKERPVDPGPAIGLS